MNLTKNFIKATDKLVALAKKKKLWHGSGYFWLLASATSKDSHAFYYRHEATKKRRVLKDDNGQTIRPQSIAGVGSDDDTLFQKLEDVKAIAHVRATGKVLAAVKRKSEQETLVEALDRVLNEDSQKHGVAMSETSKRDIRREIVINGYEWLQFPALAILKSDVAERLTEIKNGTRRNPFHGMTDEERNAACEEYKIGNVSTTTKTFKASKTVANKFARYLRVILTSGAEGKRVFDKKADPVTAAEPKEIIGKITTKRQTLPLLPEEIARVFNYTRQECRRTKNGFSDDLDVFVWQSVLVMRFAMLTGYRVGDIATLHDGNDAGEHLHKDVGECVKRPTTTHSLPVSDAMRAIIDEARAMRDGDEATLKKFGWSKPQLLALTAVRKNATPTQIMFPSFIHWGQQKQGSQLLRPALKRFAFQPQRRRISQTEFSTPSSPKPHDCRATFASVAYGIGLDLMTVADLMNHSIPENIQTPHYIGGIDLGVETIEAKMQRISDTILGLAKQARKDALTVVK